MRTMVEITRSKISKGYQTVIPAEVRAKLHGQPGDEIIWSIIGNEVFIRIKRKTLEDPLNTLIGRFLGPTNEDATANLDHVVYGDEK